MQETLSTMMAGRVFSISTNVNFTSKMTESYQTLTAPAVKIDTYDERLHLEDDISIAFDDIIDIVIGAI